MAALALPTVNAGTADDDSHCRSHSVDGLGDLPSADLRCWNKPSRFGNQVSQIAGSITEGSYIVALDGMPVEPNSDINRYLWGKANTDVKVSLNSVPEQRGARDVVVRPLADESRIRHAAWVEVRRRYVEQQSAGRLGYIHLPTMSQEGLEQFGKYYYSNQDLDGVIFDVRNNGGGSVGESLLLQLSNPPRIFHKPRYGESWTRQSWGFSGLQSVLCDGSSGSNAEEFCYGFQLYGLGPVIGSRTEGGVIGGCCGYQLVDGGVVMIPNYMGWAVKRGKAIRIIEGTGVLPDVPAPFDPVAYLAGRDTPFEQAVREMISRLGKNPPRRLSPPRPARKEPLRTGASAGSHAHQ